MATADANALLLQVSADVRGLQKAMERASGVVDQSSRTMERRSSLAVRAMEQSFEGFKVPKALRREFESLGADIGRSLNRGSQLAQLAVAGVSAYALKLAADAAEIDSAFDVAFKGASAGARDFSNVLADKVGRDAVETREAMTRLQLVLTGTGVAAGQAAEMTKRLTALGIDAGSLFNTSDAEAFQKIISGISGEAEPLKAFGVVITEAATKAELLRLGFKGNAQDASEAAKSIARANLIIKGLAVAQGDAERTAGSAANQARAMRAAFNEAARDLGAELLPVFVKLTGAATETLKAFNDLPGGVQLAGLAFLGLIAAGGPIAGLLTNLNRVIKLAQATRAAIIGAATANTAAAASGGVAAAGSAAGGGVGLAAGAGLAGAGLGVAGATGVGVFEILKGAKYQATVKAVATATDEAIAAALDSARAQIKAAATGGPAAAGALRRLNREAGVLEAEQARRAKLKPAAANPPATVEGGFTLDPKLLKPLGAPKTAKGSAADRAKAQAAAEGRLSDSGRSLPAFTLAPAAPISQGQAIGLTEFEAQRQADKLRELSATIGDAGDASAKSLDRLKDAMYEAPEPIDIYIDHLNNLGDELQYRTIGLFQDLTDSLGDSAAKALGLKGALGEFVGGLISLLAQKQLAGGGGLLSGAAAGIGHLFGFANGTDSAPGGWARINERGPEGVAFLPPGTKVIPNDVLKGLTAMSMTRGGGSSVLAPVSITLNAQGAGPREVDQLAAMVQQLRAELPSTIQRTVNDGIGRRSINAVPASPY